MFRSLTLLCRPPMRALSALTGNTYPPGTAAKLIAMGFKSELWLSENQLAVFGVEVAAEHKGKGYVTKTSEGVSITLYNAAQTSDPERVEKMKGRYAVYNAITRDRVRGGAEIALREQADKYSSNEWLTDRDVDMLGAKLKPDAKPFPVSYEFQESVVEKDGTSRTETRTVTRGYYNLEQLEDANILRKARKVMPVSVSTGHLYKGSALRTLLRTAIERGYDSPFWLTMQGAQALGLIIKNSDMGVEISAAENKVVTLYNASETSNPAQVASAAYNAKYAPRSAMSGAVYPANSQATLKAVALQKKYRSVYWLTSKQAQILGVEIRAGESGTTVLTDTGSIDLFNAEQTTGVSIINARFGRRTA